MSIEEMRLSRRRIEELLAHHTGQSIERISTDIQRDYILRGSDALEYGLVDDVITHRQSAEVTSAAGYAAGPPPE